jgi:hypothetical protein
MSEEELLALASRIVERLNQLSTPARLLEGVDPVKREQVLRQRYAHDPDGFIRAWQAGER